MFLSHTSEFAKYPDSRSYVQAAMNACIRDGFIPGDMSLWSAADNPAADECRQRVADADIYVGIIGFNYGSPVRDEPAHSYTELEYEEARARGIPTLVFLLADDNDMPFGLARGNWKYTDRQEAFRQRLVDDDLVIGTFKSPDALDNLIGQSLRRFPGPTTLRPAARKRAVPFMARQIQANRVERPALAEICSRLQTIVDRLDGDSPASGLAVAALTGPPGFGKTVLADWSAHQLRTAFPDGVLRIELGQEPTDQELIAWLTDLSRVFESECPAFATSEFAARHLADVLAQRRVLLIVDDLWRRADLTPFLQLGPATVLLITTRNPDALPDGIEPVVVKAFRGNTTREVLSHGFDEPEMDWSDLAVRTGGWPLLAGLVNGVLHAEVKAGASLVAAAQDLAHTLATGGPAALDPANQGERDRAISATVELSLGRLQLTHGDGAASRFTQLAVFPEAVDIPLELLAAWWNQSLLDVRALARTLLGMSLIESYHAGTATIRVHDVLRDYSLRSARAPGDWTATHTEFLVACRPPDGRWADLPDDADYLWRWVPWHLALAGNTAELTGTLCEAQFLARKAHVVGLPAVLDDLALLHDQLADDRRAWFRRWSHLLRRLADPVDGAATLMARPDAATYLKHWSPGPNTPWIRYAPGWACPESGERSLERVLGTHRSRVRTCAWSADGQRLASTGGDGVLRVWEIDGSTAATVPETDGWIVTVAWAPNGSRLAFGDDDGGVFSWAPDGSDQPVRLGRHARGVRALAWSADGRLLASGGDDGVRVWDRSSGSEVAALTSQPGWVRALAWSTHHEDQLACAFDDGAVVIWAPGRPTRSPLDLGRHPGGAFALCWSDNGTRLTSGGHDGVVRMWLADRRNDVVRRAEIGSSVHAVAWSADDRLLASGTDDGTVRLRRVSGRGQLIDLGRHRGGVSSVAWQPHGELLASGGLDGDIRLWRVDPTADDAAGGSGRDPVRSVAWSRDGRWLAAGTRQGVVTLWPATGGPGLIVGTDHGEVEALTWSPDGQSLAVGGDDEPIRIHSTAGGPSMTLSAPGGSTRALSWSPASNSSLACVGGDGTVQIWRFDGDAAIADGRAGESSRAIAWSPDGRMLAIGDDGGRLTLWDVGIDARPRRLGQHAGGVLAVHWDPRGNRIVTGHADGAIRWWSTDSVPQPEDLGWQMDGVQDLAWAADGARLIGIGIDGVLQVWTAALDVAQGDPQCAIAVDGSLFEVAAHPNDARVAVAGSHGVYVMDLIGPGRTDATRTAPTPRSSRTPTDAAMTAPVPGTDPFFDRTEESARIDEAVDLLDGAERHMVVFEVSGIGGIGKTRFLRQTLDRLATRSRRPVAMVWVPLDDEASSTSVGPLTSIRGQLAFDCPLFDTALLRYWAGMDRSGLPDLPADSSSALDLARPDPTDAYPIPLPTDFGRQVFDSLKPRTAQLGYRPDEFTLIDEQRADPDQLHRRLPELLGTDIARRMQNPAARRVVVCYDGYERQSATTIADHAPWLQRLLLTVDAGVHLIAGREPIGWDDGPFRNRLRSIELGGLPEPECRRMIRRDLGDLDRDVEDHLIRASGNVAFNVRALIHVCREELHRRGHVRIDRLPAGPPAVVDHFLDHLPSGSRTLAQMLAAVQYFDESLFEYIAGEVGPSTGTVAMTDFVDWFFVAKVGGGVYKTHDLLTTAVRQAGRVEGRTSDTLRRAARHLAVRTRELPQIGAEWMPPLFHALVEGWQAMEDVPRTDTEQLIDIGYHLYDAGQWRGLRQLPGQSEASEQPAKVVARYFAALSTRRIDGPVRGLELLDPLQPLRRVLGRHAASFDIERAYLRELRGDYALARQEFARLDAEADPFDPSRRDHIRARLCHADMLTMDGAFREAGDLLAEAYDLLEGGSPLDRAELMRHRGHAYRFSLQFAAAEACYDQALREAQDSPSMSAKLRTNLAESRCWHHPDLAIEDARLAIELNGRLDSKIEIAKARAALGVALARTAVPDVDQARSACDLAFTQSEKVSYPAGSCFALQALVVVDLAAGSAKSAGRADSELRQRLADLGTYGHLLVLPAWLRGAGEAFRERAPSFRDIPRRTLEARLSLIGPGPADVDDHLERPGDGSFTEDGG